MSHASVSAQQYLPSPCLQLTKSSQQSLQFPLLHCVSGAVHGGEGEGGVGCKERR